MRTAIFTLILIFQLCIIDNTKAQSDTKELYPIQFYAYMPKLLSVNSEFYTPHRLNMINRLDDSYTLDYKMKYNTNVNWFLPIHNKKGWSIINETKMHFTSSYFNEIASNDVSQISDNKIKSNLTNSFVKVVKQIPFGENKKLAIAAQINYYGYNIVNYQKLGGSVSGIVYTKNTDDKSVGYGITYDMNLHMSPIVPLIIYYQKFRKNYNLEIFLPWRVGLQKIVNHKTYLYAGCRVGYHLDFVETQKDIFSFEPDLYESRNVYIKNYVQFQRAISNFFWIEAEAGYDFSFVNQYVEPTTLKVDEPTTHFLKTNNNGVPYFKVGLVMRPIAPKK